MDSGTELPRFAIHRYTYLIYELEQVTSPLWVCKIRNNDSTYAIRFAMRLSLVNKCKVLKTVLVSKKHYVHVCFDC